MNPRSFFLRRADWSVSYVGVDGVHAVYERSLGGLDLTPPRVSLTQHIGIQHLWCRVAPTGHARIDTCGVINGCSRHRVETVNLSLHDITDLAGALDPVEAAAREIEPHDLCYCVLAGTCSRHPLSIGH